MTAKEIANKLRDKGFDAIVHNGLVVAGLNRPVNFEEIFIALDSKIEVEAMNRAGKNAIIILPDSF